MLKLLDLENLTPAIRDFAARKPVLGTCAGAILMAREVTHPNQDSLGLMDISVERNAYGRQVDSRIASLNAEDGAMEAVFIRAPVIRRAGPEALVLATYQGNPVWVEQGLHTVATFHPELTEDSRLHRRFLSKIVDSE
jgi:5'-phosphate synthase pdxT subunit